MFLRSVNDTRDTPFNLVSSNTSLAASFTSINNAAYIKLFAHQSEPTVGFTYGTSNLGNMSDPLFAIGEMGATNSASNFVIHANKIGINKIDPAYTLDVSGSINFTGDLRQNGTVFTSGSGQSSQWVSGASDISVSSNVIIGSTASSKNLTVNGTLTASNLTILGTTTINNTQTTISCNLTLSSAFAGGEALTVNGNARFLSNVYFSDGSEISQYATESYVTTQGYITTASLRYASNIGTDTTQNLNLGRVGYTTNVLGAFSSSNLVVDTSVTANDVYVNGTIQTYNAIIDGTLYATSNVSVAGMLYAQQFTLGSHLTPARIMGPLSIYNTQVLGNLVVSSNITAETLTLGGFTFSLSSATELNIKLNGSNLLTITNV